MRLYLSLLLSIITLSLCAQEAQQVLRGKIVNAATQRPVAEASVQVTGANIFSTLTDSSGSYRILVPYGKYAMLIQHKNFKSQVRENIVLSAGKQQVQDFEMNEFKVALDTVTVQADDPPGAIHIDPWNTQRVAGVFYDPARVVTSHAGVINTDDQANNLSVHGTSPTYVQWKVEGVEVVNPNHLENAGTINDRPTLNGGGISMLSAQLLQNSGFSFAPFDAASGNASSGIFDMRLRKGNDQKSERIIQASLLGTDICMEGPFSSKSRASYIFNFRYSTVGLLSLIGVNFGGEKINYTDFSYLVSVPYRKGNLRVFGIIGKSIDLFKAKTDSTEIEIQKDWQNINYQSFTAINGVSFVNSLGNSAYLKTVVAYSTKRVGRDAASGPFAPLWLPSESDHYMQDKLSTVNYVSRRVGMTSRIKAGAYINYFTTQINSFYNDVAFRNATVYEMLLQPFVSFEGTFFRKLDVEAGLHSTYQARIDFFSLQPRCQLKYNITSRHSLSLRYGRSSQLQAPDLYIYRQSVNALKPVISDALSMELLLNIRRVSFQTQLFYQLFNNTGISQSINFSGFNYFNEVLTFPVSPGGKARVYGVDLTAKRNYRSFYFVASTSIYNSEYSYDGSQYYAGRFNTSFNAVLTAGHEFKLKNDKKLIGINIRGIVRNGFKESYDTNPLNQYLYTRQIPPYNRVDFRISYRKNRLNSSYIWALDIQNVLNQKNVSYHYYDNYTGKEEVRYQLGIVPVLSFKVMF